MLLTRKHSSTSNKERFTLRDSTTGQGKTALAFNTAGLIISTIADGEAAPTVYSQAAGTIEDIAVLGTYAAPTATKCRFKKVDDTNNPGLYELQLADARYAIAGAKHLKVTISGAAGLYQKDITVQLQAFDIETASPSVNLANNAISNAALNVDSGMKATHGGTLQAGSVNGGTLANTSTATAGFYNDLPIVFFTGAGAGQTAIIKNYLADRTFSFYKPLAVAVDNTSGYRIMPQFKHDVDSNLISIDGQLTNGNNATLNLKMLNVVNNNGTAFIAQSTGGNGHGSLFQGIGTGAGFRVVGPTGINVTGSSGTALNFTGSIVATDAANDIRGIGGFTAAALTAIAGAVWNALTATYVSVGSFGKFLQDRLDAAVSSRMATFAYTTPPTTAQIAAAILVTPAQKIVTNARGYVASDIEEIHGVYAFSSIIFDENLDPNNQALLGADFQSHAQTLDMYLAIQAIELVTNQLNTMMVVIGAGPNYQYTAEALENSPASGGGGDATAANQALILAAIAALDNPVGSGADQCTFSIDNAGVGVADVDVWITSDEAGTNVVAGTLQTDSEGDVTFLLDAGNTYYLWAQKDGINPVIAHEFVAVAD